MAVDLDLALKAIPILLSVGAMVVAALAGRRKDVDRTFKEIEGQFKKGSDRMDGHELRLQSLEHRVRELPDKDALHSLEKEILKQTGTLGEMKVLLESNADIVGRLDRMVDRHQDHLLTEAKK